MPISIRRLAQSFAAEVGGVDLRRPLDDATFSAIRDAFHTHGVLVFRDQDIDDDQQIAFSERFGPLETSLAMDRHGGIDRPEMTNLSNVDADGNLYPPGTRSVIYSRGNQAWHTDSSFKPVPANGSILSGRTVPPPGVGGETEFADAAAAYDALPEARKAMLEGLVAVHWIVESRRRLIGDMLLQNEKQGLPPVRQTVVRTHSVTGRKAIYAGSHASWIEGWPKEKGFRLLRELTTFATRPEFVYTHAWRPKDIVMWDNRRVLHRGRPWQEGQHARVMRRTTLAGDGPTVAGDPMARLDAA